jgi:hypothetical protein
MIKFLGGFLKKLKIINFFCKKNIHFWKYYNKNYRECIGCSIFNKKINNKWKKVIFW